MKEIPVQGRYSKNENEAEERCCCCCCCSPSKLREARRRSSSLVVVRLSTLLIFFLVFFSSSLSSVSFSSKHKSPRYESDNEQRARGGVARAFVLRGLLGGGRGGERKRRKEKGRPFFVFARFLATRSDAAPLKLLSLFSFSTHVREEVRMSSAHDAF